MGLKYGFIRFFSIFFPESYDQTSPIQLPTLLTIHGGGFVIGQVGDDDTWNRSFADAHRHLVVGLNYQKAPWAPFPLPIEDIVTLVLAVLGDESLPIDKSRVSLAGFSAGGNLALAASQSKEIRGLTSLGWGIRAVVPIYSVLDFTLSSAEKAQTRYYKSELEGLRGRSTDYTAGLADSFDWAYIPYGTDKSDHRLSPGVSALREELPEHIFVVGAELDILAHEGWRFARKMAGLEQPGLDTRVGRPEVGTEKGALVPEGSDERFSFLAVGEGEEGQAQSVRWLLVPDALHGFDMHIPPQLVGDQEGWIDGNAKGDMVQREIAGWLANVVYATLDE